MFSGYGQTSAFVSDVMYAVEKHMENIQHMDRALDRLQEWDAGGKPVSAFVTSFMQMHALTLRVQSNQTRCTPTGQCFSWGEVPHGVSTQ